MIVRCLQRFGNRAVAWTRVYQPFAAQKAATRRIFGNSKRIGLSHHQSMDHAMGSLHILDMDEGVPIVQNYPCWHSFAQGTNALTAS